jgi:hypothetical protein
MGSLNASKGITPCFAIDDEDVAVGPTGGNVPVEASWLSGAFVVTCCSDDEAAYDSLRVPRISTVQWYTRHFFPSIDQFDTPVRIAALQLLLDNLHVFDADHTFTEFLKTKGVSLLSLRFCECS